jgi:23S rRNA pseudouridine1911/1915/1917 synthase
MDRQRLDSFLADQNPQVSRSRIQKMIKSGGIEVNGEEVTKPSLKLKEGDSVFQTAEWEEASESSSIDPIDLQLPVLYEDEDCLVINKPAGFAVHPGAGIPEGDPTILHGIAHLFTERGISFSSDGVLVHRLDKETTGCLLAAKTPEAHGLLQKQFEHRDVSKVYLAVVLGQPDPPKAIVDAPIGRNLTDRTKMSVLRTSVSREAKTTYRTLETVSSASLLQCHLHTGRTHQIRVHLSSIGHPILGDVVYSSSQSEKCTAQHNIECLCLHAWKLTFLSPTKLKEISVEAPLPVQLVSAIQGINLSLPS